MKTISRSLGTWCLVVLGTGPLALGSGFAATASVNIINFTFQPSAVTIQVGDQVTWTQKDTTQHTSTSDTGLWDSGLLTLNQTFTNTFMNAGSFPYHCTVHPFMTAGVSVQGSPPTAPTLSGARIAGGKFQFTVNGKTGQTYVVETSSDFVNWAMI